MYRRFCYNLNYGARVKVNITSFYTYLPHCRWWCLCLEPSHILAAKSALGLYLVASPQIVLSYSCYFSFVLD